MINKQKRTLILSVLSLFVTVCVGQNMSPMPAMTFKGQYDIKMISAPVLHPVWMKYNATNMDVVRAITTEDQLASGDTPAHNNYLGGNMGQINNNIDLSTAPTLSKNAGGTEARMGLAYADCDEDNTTFQSSAAYLDFGSEMACTTVEAAYLYWVSSGGTTTSYATYAGTPTMMSYPAGGNVGTNASNNNILFKTPLDANYGSVTADRNYAAGSYTVHFANITTKVQGKGGGLYWCANIGSSSSAGSPVAGWTMVVIFRPPNCPPRVIKFWEGTSEMSDTSGWDLNLDFAAGEVPNSGNSVSYLGVCALDGEGYGLDLISKRGLTLDQIKQIAIGFKSTIGGVTVGQAVPNINPFIDQPYYSYYDFAESTGFIAEAIDGIFCSRISSWDKELMTNGNDMIRLPNNRYTCGYDAHHIKLPAGSLGPGATRATMSLVCERGPSDCGGGYTPFMAYMAIETLQPDLKLEKKAKSASTSPDGVLTYVFTVKNVGPLASQAGAYITDELDKVIDFVDDASVKFYDKNLNPLTPDFSVQNKGADVNEVMTFTLPAIAAGNGTLANDSITIEFDVKLKDLTRTDIWGYGCNRYVRNKATLTFKADDGTDLNVGSNSSASCDGAGLYYSTPVIDVALETQYNTTHNVSATLTDQVQAGPVNIVNTVTTYLTDQLTTLGLPTSEVSLYEIYNESGVKVGSSEIFTQDEPVQNYTAEADFGGGCIETYYFEFLVAKVPQITSVTPSLTSSVGASDGTVNVLVEDGDPGYYCKVVDTSNDNIVYYAGYSPSSDTEYDFLAEGLAAGIYKIIVGDRGTKTVTSTFTITDPPVLTLTISGPTQVCEGSAITLSANQSGRPAGTSLEYVWYESTDNFNWTKLPEVTSVLTTTPSDPTTYYQAYVCDGAAFAVADHQVDALSTPEVRVLNSDSGCYEFNLVDVQYEQLNTDLLSTDYTVTYHTSNPSSATDNRFIIPTSQYIIKKKQDVWVRLSVNDFCYDTDKGKIYIKSMEECYPLIISDFFSPDGDGYNDRWEIGGLEGYNNPEIIVYDRFGKVVFKGGKEDLLEPNGWDGTYLGNPLPSADYWYQMNFLEIKPKVGHFTLKRKKE